VAPVTDAGTKFGGNPVRRTLSGLVAVGLALALAACGTTDAADENSGVNANQGATVGIALPTEKQTRWTADGNNMVEQFSAMKYTPNLKFADDDAKNQVAQIQAMINSNAKLLVIGAVDGTALTEVLANAAKAKIPVIAYDRLIRDSPNVNYYATFDNFRVGVLQGNLLVERLHLADGKGPFTIELFAGSPDDNNATFFFNGAFGVLKPYLDSGQLVIKSGQKDFKTVSTQGWDGAVAAKRMKELLKAYYSNDKVDAVLSPNDGIASGILKELKGNGYGTKARPLPLISGQDAEVNSLKSIIAGEQTGTIYKDTRELAKVAVQMGNALLTGAAPITNDTTTYDNGLKVVPTYLLQPIAVDKANYRTLLVDGGYYTEANLS
jgi:putative multiple sugar transport system substrate-binding protein